jgi:hypothetical protein
MNLTGYKQHKKGMRNMLNAEEAKPSNKRNQQKIDRLESCISRCSGTIRRMQADLKAKRKKANK